MLINAFTSYEDFVGSTYYKHLRLFKYYTMLTNALKDTSALIYPSNKPDNFRDSIDSQASQLSTSMDGSSMVKENIQILPKRLQRVLQAIKEFNYSYSVLTPQTNLLSGNIVTSNMHSKKVGVNSLKKLCVFDQIIFGRTDDYIKQILFSTFPRNFRVAVFYRRQL